MKKIPLLAILIILSLSTSAQKQKHKNFRVRNKSKETEFLYGIKGGLNYANLAGDFQGGSYKIGFNAGVFGLFKLGDNFAVMPEVVYSVQGAQSKTSSSTVKVDYNYINVPLLVNFYASQVLFFQVGPQIGVLTSSSISDASNSLSIYNSRTPMDLSFDFGVGLDFEKVLVNARYNAGLTSTSSSGVGSYPNSVYQVSVNVPINQFIENKKKRN